MTNKELENEIIQLTYNILELKEEENLTSKKNTIYFKAINEFIDKKEDEIKFLSNKINEMKTNLEKYAKLFGPISNYEDY